MTSTVVVLSQRPGDWLGPCLASAAAQADEVILVDNGSVDATASAVGRSHGARVVRAETNLGYAGGVNRALREVRSDVVALLNDDAVAGPGWLDSAAAILDAAADVAAVTPKVRLAGWYLEVIADGEAWSAPGDPRVLGRQLRGVEAGGVDVLARVVGPGVHRLESDATGRWRWTVPGLPLYVPVEPGDAVVVDGEPVAGPVCRLLNKAGSYLRSDGILGDHGAESPDDGRWDAPAERFFASGTALVARTETFARVGGLADEFFAYYEDGDWSWRARLAGLRLLYEPAGVVDHRLSATSGGMTSPWVWHLAQRNRTLSLVRNAPVPVVAGALRRVAADGPLGGVRADVARLLPWALRSRRRLARTWRLRPEEVWERWAGADTTWDDGPVRLPAPDVSGPD